MTKEILLKKVGSVIERSEELSALKGENFNVFQIFDMERDENKMHSRFIETLLNPKGSHNRGNVFLKLFLASINQTDYFENIESVNTKVEYTIGRVDNSKGDDSTGGRIDINIWDNKKNISIENKIYASDQYKQIIRYNNYNKNNNKVYYLTLYKKNPSNDSRGSLTSDIEEPNEPDFYCISYKETIINWLEKCQKEASDFPIIRESIKQYIITIKRLTGQLTNQVMNKEIIKLIKDQYEEAREIVNNIDEAKKLITKEFLEDLEIKIKDKIKENNLSKEWITELEDIADGKEYRKLWTYRQCSKNRKLSVVIEGQPYFWEKETVLGFHKGLSEINLGEKAELEDYLKESSINRSKYPKSSNWWLMYRTIFKFGNEDEFKKYTFSNRDGHIDEVSSEIIDLVKQIENYFE